MGPPGVSAPFKEIFFFALLKKCVPNSPVDE